MIIKYLSIFSLYAYDKVYFPSISYITTMQCNLKCKNCLSFTVYNKEPHRRDFNEMKLDIDRYFENIDYTDMFHISGGEPFLNKELGSLVEYVFRNYKSNLGEIAVTTNGTVIPDPDLCDKLAKNCVVVYVDDYQEQVELARKNLGQVICKLNQCNISFKVNGVDEWIKLYPALLEMKSKNELKNQYIACQNPYCSWRDGKLYFCNYSDYAIEAGITMEEKEDYLSVTDYEKNQRKALLTEACLGCNYKGYVSFCSKCAGFTPINPFKEVVAEQK